MMHRTTVFKYLCIVPLIVWAGLLQAKTNDRFALLIGNGAYNDIGALHNPTADARLIADTLSDLGFESTLILDADQASMKHQIANFGRKLRAAEKSAIGFFYYAGHGVQAQGKNYLLPVEASPNDPADLDLMGVEANWVLRQMESAGNRTNIIVLDACRNNPFVASNRSLGRGLAQIDAPTGSFISYATAPGKVALDGEGRNSPFSAALAKALPRADLAIEQVFKQVRIDVIKSTNGAQTPWDSSSLVEDLVMNSTSETLQPLISSGESTPETTSQVELDNKQESPAQPDNTDHHIQNELILAARESGLTRDYQTYLERYPNGTFADLANAEIANMSATEAVSTDKGVPRGTSTELRFNQPLGNDPQNPPRSFKQLIDGSPMFAPIDGLPEEHWLDKSCSNCHQWNAERLCEQGQFYLDKTTSMINRAKHPYGGFFKESLKLWTEEGCLE